MLKIDYIKEADCPFSKKIIDKAALIFGKKMFKKTKETEVVIVSDAKMKKINFVYRGKKRTTDVLSFSFLEDKKIKTDFLGQIFISYPQIKRQAKKYKIPEKEEFVRMLVHGLLHLVGYDHVTKAEEQKMFKFQELLVSKILNTCPSIITEERRRIK